jgi:prevent-host-death family protein
VPVTTLSSREFNQDASGAKRAARKGPVIITDRGRPAHVLLTIEAYEKLTRGTRKTKSIAELLAMPGVEQIEFEAPRLGRLTRPADLA